MATSMLITLIMAGVSLLLHAIPAKKPATSTPTPGTPAVPPNPASPAATPAPADDPNDAFAGLPFGLPHHPVLNAINQWLSAVSPAPGMAPTSVSTSMEATAIAGLAHAVKQSPTALAAMQAALK